MRLIQMGENKKKIYLMWEAWVLMQYRKQKLLKKMKLKKKFNFKFLKKNLLVTFHPSDKRAT